MAAEKNEHINAKVRAEMGINFFALINSELGSSSGNSQKVLETFKVTTTKSLILSEVIQKSKHVSTLLDGLKIGALIRIDNVSLSLENELELRSVRTFSNNSDLFKGMSLPEVEGLDASNLLNAVLKDYAYKIKGKTSTGERVLIKIPLTFENEFENSYSIDDLFIGDVTVVGIYKGKTTTQKLKGTFEYFQKLGQESEKDENSDCELKNSEVVE
ncbi:MAG: hypothetical protein LRY51_06020, partial [Geovibrio sp.]|nr:hypothetical protein [Geovibrio sp.]